MPIIKRNRSLSLDIGGIFNTAGDITSLFPGLGGALGGIFNAIGSLFGGGRHELTASDWQKVIPGNGKWTTMFRNYMAQHIKYDVDLGNVQKFTPNFVYDHQPDLCGLPAGDGNPPDQFNACVNMFYQVLLAEKNGAYDGLQAVKSQQASNNTGGGLITTPGGVTTSNAGFSFNWATVALIGGGLYLIMNKR